MRAEIVFYLGLFSRVFVMIGIFGILQHVDLDRIVLDLLVERIVFLCQIQKKEREKDGKTCGKDAEENHCMEDSVGWFLTICSFDSIFHDDQFLSRARRMLAFERGFLSSSSSVGKSGFFVRIV